MFWRSHLHAAARKLYLLLFSVSACKNPFAVVRNCGTVDPAGLGCKRVLLFPRGRVEYVHGPAELRWRVRDQLLTIRCESSSVESKFQLCFRIILIGYLYAGGSNLFLRHGFASTEVPFAHCHVSAPFQERFHVRGKGK